MIRSIRLRLQPVAYRAIFSPRSTTSRATATAALENTEDDDQLLWGTDYGAGPSRRPYQPPPPITPITAVGPVTDAATRRWTSALQTAKDKFASAGVLSSDVALLDALGNRKESLPWDELDRLETHVILEYLISHGEPLEAAKIITHLIESGLSSHPERRRLFDVGILAAVFELGTLPRYSSLTDLDRPVRELRAKRRGRQDIDTLLLLLYALQKIRHERGNTVYKCLIQRCMGEGLIDDATKVYVGQVEEWITEGRVGEGAKPDDFYHGGGPPRKGRDELEISSSMLKTWWKGVRSWALPGEVLSPHDRLDLWHPKRLALTEKLRRFPLPVPTSPPSLVPSPSVYSLRAILDGMVLDPDEDLEAFKVSMRASAMLANTILNRTLPYISKSILVDKLSETRFHPPVYPEHIAEPPSHDDAWAYTAYTHIHLALQSILFAPPQPPELVQYMKDYEDAKAKDQPPPPLPPRHLQYMTKPIGFHGIVTLAIYGMRRVRTATAIKVLLGYAKDRYGMGTLPQLYDSILRGMTFLRNNAMAKQADNILFEGSPFSSSAPPLSSISRRPVSNEPQEPTFNDTFDIPKPDKPVFPDERSFHALLLHLVATGQGKRFVDIIYRAIPFLQFSKNMTAEELEKRITETKTRSRLIGPRPRPREHSPATYGIMLYGLQEFGMSGLAHRVFLLALDSELVWAKESASDEIPPEKRITIDSFTAMIQVWDCEARRAINQLDTDGTLNRRKTWEMGEWAPPGFERLPRHLSAPLMVMATYKHARERWLAITWDPITRTMYPDRAGRSAPGGRFFNAMVHACSAQWGLRDGHDWSIALRSSSTSLTPLSQRVKSEITMIVDDMRQFGIPVPKSLRIRLGLCPPLGDVKIDKMDRSQILMMSKVPVEKHWSSFVPLDPLVDLARAHLDIVMNEMVDEEVNAKKQQQLRKHQGGILEATEASTEPLQYNEVHKASC